MNWKLERRMKEMSGFSMIHTKIVDQVWRNVVKETGNKYNIKTTSKTFTNERKSTYVSEKFFHPLINL